MSLHRRKCETAHVRLFAVITVLVLAVAVVWWARETENEPLGTPEPTTLREAAEQHEVVPPQPIMGEARASATSEASPDTQASQPAEVNFRLLRDGIPAVGERLTLRGDGGTVSGLITAMGSMTVVMPPGRWAVSQPRGVEPPSFDVFPDGGVVMLEMVPRGKLSGRVVDDQGKAVQDATVYFVQDGRLQSASTYKTELDGVFSVEVIGRVAVASTGRRAHGLRLFDLCVRRASRRLHAPRGALQLRAGATRAVQRHARLKEGAGNARLESGSTALRSRANGRRCSDARRAAAVHSPAATAHRSEPGADQARRELRGAVELRRQTHSRIAYSRLADRSRASVASAAAAHLNRRRAGGTHS